jgi:hypothetical protein
VISILWCGVLGLRKEAEERAVKHIGTYQYPINADTRRDERVRFWRPGFAINMPSYLKKKPNQNLLITGTTGQGKSKLMRLMLESMPNPKNIFSYKDGDEYLQIDGNLIFAEQKLPNPFSDHDAFASAFAITFGISSEGIQTSTAMSLVYELAKESASWKEL